MLRCGTDLVMQYAFSFENEDSLDQWNQTLIEHVIKARKAKATDSQFEATKVS